MAVYTLGVGGLSLTRAGLKGTSASPSRRHTISIPSPKRLHLSALDSLACRCNSATVSEASGNGNAPLFSVTSATESDVDYLGESTKGDLNLNRGIDGAVVEGPIEEVARMEAQEAGNLLKNLGIQGPYSANHSPRGIFCSRTLNLRSIGAIGYDMDYTLMHYNVMVTAVFMAAVAIIGNLTSNVVCLALFNHFA